MPTIVDANSVIHDTAGRGKSWQGHQGINGKESSVKYAIRFILIPTAVFILLSGIILVSITWTHRPDLSVTDIFREAVKEIFKCWQSASGKEKKNEQHYHL